MGLIANYYDSKYDITIENCYWKIDSKRGIDGGKEELRINIVCYKSKVSADLKKDRYSSKSFTFTPDVSETSDNFIKQAYNYAKTLDLFKDAVDA